MQQLELREPVEVFEPQQELALGLLEGLLVYVPDFELPDTD